MRADLVRMRLAKGIPQAEVAERIAVSVEAVAEFERYDSDPALSLLTHYALAIGAEIEFRVTDFEGRARVLREPSDAEVVAAVAALMRDDPAADEGIYGFDDYVDMARAALLAARDVRAVG